MGTIRRDVTGVRSVTLCDWGELVVTQGLTESLTVDAAPEVLERLLIEIRGTSLTLQVGRDLQERLRLGLHSSLTRPPIHYELCLRDLDRLSVAGAGLVRVGPLTTTTLELDVNGAPEVHLTGLTADRLTVSQHGSGCVVAAGKASRQRVSLLGAGEYSAEGLQTHHTSVIVHGAGHVRVWATDELQVSSMGIGLVEYRGRPVLDRRGFGLGALRAMG